MNCSSCNAVLKETDTICPSCGNVVVKKERGNISFPVNPLSKPLSVWAYFGMFLIGLIPVVNLICYFIWAFSSRVNVNRRNFSRAMIFIVILFYILIFACVLFSLLFFDFKIPMHFHYYF